MIDKNPGYTRRHFLQSTIGGLTVLPIACGGFGSETPEITEMRLVRSRFRVPDTTYPVNIDYIVEALSSGETLATGNYIPAFLNFIQHTHLAVNGSTFQQDMEATFGNSNPIDVLVVEGLFDAEGDYGRFFHRREAGRPNEALLDSSLNPAIGFIYLNHEMWHSGQGQTEIGPYVFTYRDICYMVANSPQLLRENDEECLLAQIMNDFMNTYRIEGEERSISYSPSRGGSARRSFLGTLAVRGADFWDSLPGESYIEKTVDIIRAGDLVEGPTQALENLVVGKTPLDVIRIQALNLALATEEYILQLKPDFPNRELLTQKLDSVRTRFD